MWAQKRSDIAWNPTVGQMVYLAEVQPDGQSSFAQASPIQYRKNLSGVPCEAGWCGTTDNVSTTATGKGKIMRVAGEFDQRLLIKRV